MEEYEEDKFYKFNFIDTALFHCVFLFMCVLLSCCNLNILSGPSLIDSSLSYQRLVFHLDVNCDKASRVWLNYEVILLFFL